MMLLYNVYVCLLKFLRKFVNVWGLGLFLFLIICAMVLYFTVQCYVHFVGFYFECATCLIFIY